jgi:hypothetical protein
MTPQTNGRGVLSLRAADISMTCFQQLFTAFCVFMTDIWLFLFFHVSNSKLQQLLITIEASESKNQNRNQTNFDSNVAIRTFDHKPKQTFSNCLSLFEGTALMPCVRWVW